MEYAVTSRCGSDGNDHHDYDEQRVTKAITTDSSMHF